MHPALIGGGIATVVTLVLLLAGGLVIAWGAGSFTGGKKPQDKTFNTQLIVGICLVAAGVLVGVGSAYAGKTYLSMKTGGAV